MTDWNREECKDAAPRATLNRIKKILSDLPIALVEKNTRSTRNTFTTILSFKGTAIGSQGKGVSKVLSRASAYAEFIERLQNMILAAPFNLSPEVLSFGRFRFAPDEKKVSSDYVAGLNRKFKHAYSFTGDSRELREGKLKRRNDEVLKWLQIGRSDESASFIGLPFCSLRDGKIYYIPWQMLTLYRSNGMCAGNTREEALVQGISEILERHVNKVMINTPVTPPDIPLSFVKKFKKAYKIIAEIEAAGKYRVIVKDCSLGIGCPVLGVILVSLSDKSYMVNFGAHPRFEIALERCLTEALQSYKVDSRLSRSLLPFAFLEKPVPNPSNYINAVRLGRGHYPASIFLKRSEYEFLPWADPGRDNKKLLNYLLLFVKKLGADVLVRDKSFLGFPAFQAIIPGISEVEEPVDIFVPSVILKNEVAAIMLNLPLVSEIECEKILTHIIGRLPYMMDCRKVSGFLSFPVKNSFPWDSLSVPLFLAMICRRKGDLNKCHGMVNSIVNNWNRAVVSWTAGQDHDYLKCVRDYLAALKSNISEDQIPVILRRFYPAPLVRRVVSEWGEPDKVFEKFDVLPCWACAGCKLRKHCLKNYFKSLYCVLKSKIAKNPIDQKLLKEFALHA